MAFISHKVSVIFLVSLFVMSLLVYCATANNKTNKPSYKMVSDILLGYVQENNILFGMQMLIFENDTSFYYWYIFNFASNRCNYAANAFFPPKHIQTHTLATHLVRGWQVTEIIRSDAPEEMVRRYKSCFINYKLLMFPQQRTKSSNKLFGIIDL